jgi:hypothetical protein
MYFKGTSVSPLSGSRLVELDVRLCIRVTEGTGTEQEM